MKFYLLLEGPGEGCDYTIGCNKTWREFNASDLPAALAKANKIILEEGEERVEKAALLSVEAVQTVDVRGLFREAEEMRRKRAKTVEERAERTEYERLKKKFGEG